MSLALRKKFHILCPCNCGMGLPVYCNDPGDVNQFANEIWQELVEDKGLEASVEFLHANGEQPR